MRKSDSSDGTRTGSPNAQLEHLRWASETRDELLAVAAHEIKTPLTTLGLQVESLLRSLRQGKPVEPDRLGAKLERMGRQLERVGQLVERVLDVARIQSGQLGIEPELVDLVEVAREVGERLAPRLELAGSTLAITGEAKVVGHWDRVRLDQIVTNLLDNANRYGGGGPVEIRCESVDQTAVLTVSDEGAGIDLEHRATIFEPVERRARGASPTGLGLDLYITLGLVQAMRGTISVDSEREHGSAFVVRLPLTHDSALPGQA